MCGAGATSGPVAQPDPVTSRAAYAAQNLFRDKSEAKLVTLTALRNYVPGPWKQAARAALQRQQLRRAMRHLVSLPIGTVPDHRLLAELRSAWDNEGFTADLDYLAEVARLAAATPGPVLECGSGLTTLLLGALAGRRGVEVWSLEHDADWRRRVSVALREHITDQVYLWLSPLTDYGEFDWYAATLRVPTGLVGARRALRWGVLSHAARPRGRRAGWGGRVRAAAPRRRRRRGRRRRAQPVPPRAPAAPPVLSDRARAPRSAPSRRCARRTGAGVRIEGAAEVGVDSFDAGWQPD